MSLGVRALAVLAGFAITFFIGHKMGPAANGHYAVVTQTAALLSAIAAGGFDLAIIREFTPAAAQKKRIARSGLLIVFGLILTISMIVTGGLFIVGWLFAVPILGERLTTVSFVLLSTIFITRTISRISSAFLRAQQKFVLSQCVELLWVPSIVLSLLLYFLPRSIDQILLWTAVAGIFTNVTGIAANIILASSSPESFRQSLGALWGTALPLSGVALTLNFTDWYSLSVVALCLGIADAGIYRVSMQFGSMLWIVTAGLYAVFGARIGTAFAANDLNQVARICRSAMQLAVLIIVPAAAALILTADEILRFIGTPFVTGVPIIRIVVVGQVLIAVSGASGIALTMSGNAKLNFVITLGGLVAMLIIAPASAWMAGPVGVAAGVTIITVGMSGANLWALHRVSGINAITGSIK